MWNLVGTVGISVSFESLRCQVPFVAGAQDGVDDGRGNLATGGVWVRSRVAMASLLAFLPRRHWRADPPRGSMARLHTVGSLPTLPQSSADIHKGKERGGEDTSTFRRRPMGRTPTIGGRTTGRAVGHGPEGQRGHHPYNLLEWTPERGIRRRHPQASPSEPAPWRAMVDHFSPRETRGTEGLTSAPSTELDTPGTSSPPLRERVVATRDMLWLVTRRLNSKDSWQL